MAAAVVLMRPISILWLLGLVAVVVIGMSASRRRDLLSWRLAAWAIGPTAAAVVLSWLWVLYSQFKVSDDRLDRTLPLGTALRRSVDAWPTYFRQSIGILGWVDTTLPFFVYVAWTAALVVVVVIHLRSAVSRGFAALVALVAVWLALPLVINGFTNSRAGITYQGRYSLPIFVGLMFLPLWNDRSTLRWPRVSQRGLVATVLVLVVVAEVGAFWQMLRRFAVGANGKIMLTGNLPWSPQIAPMLLIVVNLAAMLAVSWSAWRPWGQIEAAPGERHGEGA
jgi:hypothetical protein